MSRLFWVAAGAVAGVLVVRRVTRTAAAITPPALAASLTAALRDFALEVRLGMAEREAELRSQLGLDGGTPHGATLDGGAAGAQPLGRG